MSPAFAFAVYLVSAALDAGPLPRWASALVAAELVYASALLRASNGAWLRSVKAARLFWAGAALHLAAFVGLGHPRAAAEWLSLLGARDQLGRLTTPEMARTVAELALVQAGPWVLLLALALAVNRAIAPRAWSWTAPLLAAAACAFFAVTGATAGGERTLALDLEVRAGHPDWSRALHPSRPPPPFAKAKAGSPSVVVVVIDSLGRPNLEEHEAAHQGCRFPAWRRRGLDVRTLIPTGNATHISHPGIIASFQPLRFLSRWNTLQRPRHALLSMPAYFHGKGYRTLLVSTMDERYFGMDRFTLSEPWDVHLHPPDGYAEVTDYDQCGTRKTSDGSAIARLIAETRAGPAPFFAWLNLQDLHYPYRLEAPGEASVPSACGEFDTMPAASLAVQKERYGRALIETEERLARLFAAAPEAVFLVLGDHGEELVAGPRFGHAKDTTLAQDSTAALLFGPGVRPQELTAPASAVDLLPTLIDLIEPRDLDALPEGLVQGASLLRPRGDLPILTTSQGFFIEVAVLAGGVKERYSPGRFELCSTVEDAELSASDPRCRRARSLLRDWLSCQLAFYADFELSGRFFNPCPQLAREAAAR